MSNKEILSLDVEGSFWQVDDYICWQYGNATLEIKNGIIIRMIPPVNAVQLKKADWKAIDGVINTLTQKEKK